MRAACDGGMSAAEAARWVRSQSPKAPDPVPPVAGDASGFEASQRLLLDAIERMDDVALDARLRQVMFLGSATTILDEIISPTLIEIGRRWHQGELSIAHEHFASHRLATMLRDLVRLAAGPESSMPVLLAAFADDEHELGLLGLAVRFGAWGLRPIFLGARTPPGALRKAIDSVAPGLVTLSVTVTPDLARARELVDDYAVACGTTPWLVGGTGVAPLAEIIRRAGGHVDPGPPDALRDLVAELTEAAPRRGKK